MLSSPRRPSSTMRIFSSAEIGRRVARRMSFTICSAGRFSGPDVCLIFAPDGYDEPEILRSREPSICLKGADAGQPTTFTPPRLPPHASDLQDRGGTVLADCDRSGLTRPTERAFMTSLRFA
jgi:hypothetical protein